MAITEQKIQEVETMEAVGGVIPYGFSETTDLTLLDNPNTAIKTKSVKEFTPFEVFNAIQKPTERVSNSIGEKIALVGVTVQDVICKNREGERIHAPRVILYAADGKTYEAVSETLYSSVINLMGVFPMENWPKDGLKVKIDSTSKGEMRYFGIVLVK